MILIPPINHDKVKKFIYILNLCEKECVYIKHLRKTDDANGDQENIKEKLPDSPNTSNHTISSNLSPLFPGHYMLSIGRQGPNCFIPPRRIEVYNINKWGGVMANMIETVDSLKFSLEVFGEELIHGYLFEEQM